MALVKKIAITGKVETVLLSANRDDGLEKHSVDELDMVFSGIKGDCHQGLTRSSDGRMTKLYERGTPVANSRQVSILSREELAEICQAMEIDDLPPEWVGANIVTTGIPDLTRLPPSTRMVFSSGATIIVDLENGPCRYVGDIIDKYHPGKGRFFVKAAMGKRGVVGRVEKEGKIKPEDDIILHIPVQRIYRHGNDFS
jgi:MOSC domain-containing protein YiiM